MGLLELASETGLEPKRVSSTKGGEFASPCPDCGGHDRFRIWPNQQMKNCTGAYWCRKCEKRGDAIQFCMDFLGLSFNDASAKIGAVILKRTYVPHTERSFVAPTLIVPSMKWSQRAKDFVVWANEQIWRFPDKVEQLKQRGISEEAIKTYQIGYCDRDIWVDPSEFGIESEKKLFFPEGFVIPSIEPSGHVVRLKIRRAKWQSGDELPKYWAVRGSMNGLSLVGSVKHPVMVVVESEFDAYALHHTCGDLLFAVSIGGSTKTPDNVTDYWAKNRKLIVCHDNDEGGLCVNEKWKKLYPHAQSCPVPIESKDIGEFIQKGFDLRKWLLDSLTTKK